MSLTPYSGPWTAETAGHLLRRTTFGHTKAELKEAVSKGMEDLVDQLLATQTPPEPPLNYSDQTDTNAPIGSTWVNSPHTGENSSRVARFRSLSAWHLLEIAENRMHIMPRMLMFWHNHFVVDFDTVRDPRSLYTYWETLRRNGLGNFQTLVEEITIDPAMLRYLDGRTNTLRNPNENYARELMELFTLGKGDLAGPGDYTTFTEDDVLEVARILTGWRDVGYNSTRANSVTSQFVARNHDTGDKQLSHRFNNAVIQDAGIDEYKNLIRVIFQKEEVSEFIVRKLYRFFVATEVDDAVESDIIGPLAAQFRADNYQVEGVMRTLLKSQHFYDQLEVQGGVITNPLENIFKVLITVGTNESGLAFQDRYAFWWTIANQAEIMQMSYYNAPDVAGWMAYYLEPQFSELWINSVTIRNRQNFVTTATNRFVNRGSREIITLDYLGFLGSLDNPSDVWDMIDEMSELFFPKKLSSEQRQFLRDELLPGLPDFVWTNEYEAYLADPQNPQKSGVIVSRLRDFFRLLFIVPEFQII